MLEEIRKDAEVRMHKSIESLNSAFSKVRTGRAHTSLLDHVKVSYYGSDVPLSQVANVAVADSRMLTVSTWEKTMAAAVEKAITQSDLGLNPSSSGDLIRVPIPALTEDRRRDLIKVVRADAEAARVAIRNIRRDANGSMKDLLKEKEISEDDERRGQDLVQKLTDQAVADADKALAEKETELLEI